MAVALSIRQHQASGFVSNMPFIHLRIAQLLDTSFTPCSMWKVSLELCNVVTSSHSFTQQLFIISLVLGTVLGVEDAMWTKLDISSVLIKLILSWRKHQYCDIATVMSLWQLTREVKESFLEGNRLGLKPEGSVEGVILAKGGRTNVPDMGNSICKDPVVRSPENTERAVASVERMRGSMAENEVRAGIRGACENTKEFLPLSWEKYKANDCF